MTSDAKELVHDSLELTSLPAVVMKAMELLNDPDASASDLGAIIGQDPALTAKLLKIVNSAFYDFPSRIDTVSRAITIIGTLELTDLILGSSAVQVFARIPNKLINMEKFWEHNLYVAIVARILSRYLRAPNTERCFVMGLLHDIGALVLYRERPEASRRAVDMARERSIPLHVAEQEIFGFHHGEVGAELMRAWRLPESFVEIAQRHHQPSSALRYRLETAIIHLADVITGMAHSTGSGTGQPAPLEAGAWEMTGLGVDIMEQVVADADAQFEEACAAILPYSKAA